MDMKWSLDSLYESFDSQELKEDLGRVFSEIESLNQWCKYSLKGAEKPVLLMEEYINRLNRIMDKLALLRAYAELTSSADVKNADAVKLGEKLEVKLAEVTEANVVFNKWLCSIEDIDSIIGQSPLLMEHSFYLKEIVTNSRYMLGEKEEEIIARLKSTGSSAWNNLQKSLASNLMAEILINGKKEKLPITQVMNLGFSDNAAVRKAAYESEIEAYKKIDEAVAASLNAIKGEVIATSRLRGYSSPLEKTLADFRMNRKTLDAMLGAVQKKLPVFQAYYKKKAELLGYAKGLPYYEIFAPVGKSSQAFTYTEARDYVVSSFRCFSEKLAVMAETAFDNSWIDVEPRMGKRSGAFCYGIHPLRESRILSNFSGSYRNVITLAHELGHAYHNLNLYDETYLNCKYPSPIAETASIFCEALLQDAALTTASTDAAYSILNSSLSKSCSIVVDIYSRYLFETEVFKRREQGSLSVDELKELMEESQKQAFGDSLDHSLLHPYMWVNKPHYYYPEKNFYNFPYTFGLLFAKGLYAKYLEDRAGFPVKYDQLLSLTGKMSVADITASVGIDITTEDFWLDSIKQIEEEINKFINISHMDI